MSAPLALRGRVWQGAGPLDDHVVIVHDRVVQAIVPYADAPSDVEIVGTAASWVGPGVYDRHVHLAFGSASEMVAGGVLRARDLGAPGDDRATADAAGLVLHRAGRLLTAPDGYPSRTWGADGFASFASSAEQAAEHCRAEHARGADVVKVALEDADGQPPLRPEVLGAAVATAHELGLPVVAHALSVAMVERALDAGVDELAHTPTEPLPGTLIERIAEQRVEVCSTLQTFFAEGRGEGAARNAAALVAAGVRLHYASDLGNAGTRPGVDPRELERLAAAGLGREGALRAALDRAIEIGAPARLVVLVEDPVCEPAAWRTPIAVLAPPAPLGPAPAQRSSSERQAPTQRSSSERRRSDVETRSSSERQAPNPRSSSERRRSDVETW